MSLLVNDNPHVLWHETIKEAENRCSVQLDQHLEIYLVSLLTRYTDKPDMVKRLFATALLEALEKAEAERNVMLQRVGDECLIFSGFFPRAAEQRHVNIRYFVDIGRSAYSNMSHTLFDNLATEFVSLMDVLQSIKSDVDLLPLEAYEQWEMLGSKRALKILQGYSRNSPGWS